MAGCALSRPTRMAVDLAALVEPPRQVVANLPYNIASPLLVRWLRQAAAFERLTLMFQQEVAERICAAPGGGDYGRLSVLAQWTCDVALVQRIPPAAFVPPPKVWSAVVRLTPHAMQPDAACVRADGALTAAAFGQRRKMLRGALKPLGGEALLHATGIAPERRAETLTVGEFERLARATKEKQEIPLPLRERVGGGVADRTSDPSPSAPSSGRGFPSPPRVTATTTSAPRPSAFPATGRQAEQLLPIRARRVFPLEHAAFLQHRHHQIR